MECENHELSSSLSNSGRSSIEDKPKLLKNKSVVPYSIGLPGASNLPVSFIKPLFINVTNE